VPSQGPNARKRSAQGHWCSWPRPRDRRLSDRASVPLRIVSVLSCSPRARIRSALGVCAAEAKPGGCDFFGRRFWQVEGCCAGVEL
jgi:hypothetical protein